MTDFKTKQITRQHAQHLVAAPEKVFALLRPTREQGWIEPRECELIGPDSGFAEVNCVFRTGVLTHGVEEVWGGSRYEPSTRIDFTRFNGRRFMAYSIVLEAAANGTTTAHNTHVVTALNEEGNRLLAGEAGDAFASGMKVGEMLLNLFPTAGKKLPIAAAVQAVRQDGNR